MSERDARTVMYEREAAQVRAQREHEALARERTTAGGTRTLRDWFAGQALAGLLGDPNCDSMSAEWHAETSYRFADAVLERADESRD